MIVNPQLFNYRLTIGVLVVAISILAFFGHNAYNELKSENDFIKQEKKLIQSEISKVIADNDKLEDSNKVLNLEAENYKTVIGITSDSIKTIQTNAAKQASRYEANIDHYQSQNQNLITQIDALRASNKQLQENRDELTQITKDQSEELNLLKSENEEFADRLIPKMTLVKETFTAEAFRVRKNHYIKTKNANKANSIQVCFTLSNDIILAEDNNELYIQVIDPNNNIMADKGAVQFDDLSLIYSYKTKAVESYRSLDICETIFSNEKLVKGMYHINVFGNEKQLGSTQLELY